MDWAGLEPLERGPQKISPTLLGFCQETVCVLTTLLRRLCVTGAKLTSEQTSGMHRPLSASLAGHRLPQGFQQSSSVQHFYLPLTPSLRHVSHFTALLKKQKEACEAECRQWWDDVTPCGSKTPEALLCSVTRVAAEEERKEKSTPVGVGYGRPWIDQWRLGA